MSEHTGYPGAPPGWYADPAGGPGQRWWDGYAWTEATVLPQQPPPPPHWAAAGPPQTAPAAVAPWAAASERLNMFNTAAFVNDEIHLTPVARVAVAVPAVFAIALLIWVRANAQQLRTAGHQLRINYHDAQTGTTPQPYHINPSGSLFIVVAALLTVAAVIVACVWQHRAASAARALGLPSSCSPAWGVGAWFVPFVNVWIPYMAVRDCLPPGHVARSRVARWWLVGLAAGWLTFAAWICSFFSAGAALAVSIPAALAALAALAIAPGVVMAIAASHRETMARVTAETAAFSG